MKRMTGCVRVSVFLTLFCLFAGMNVLAADISVRVDTGAEECVKHGAEVIAAEFAAKKLAAEVAESGAGDVFTVYVGTMESAWIDELKSEGMSMPEVSDKPESYSLVVQRDKENPLVVALGKDSVGAMYAAYDLADQVRAIPVGADIFSYLTSRDRAPFLQIRAVNPFLHVQAFQDQDSWYYDESFWEDYLDLLSRSRFNLIDFHAMYDIVSTWFPNVYLYMVKSDKFPEVGLPKEQAEKNFDMFKKIVAMAKDRGIRVSLMSYHASWGLLRNEEEKPHTPSEEELTEYTRDVVRRVIEEIPDLWMIGFRIGESGMKESFYEDSYLAGIKDAGKNIRLFTRTWGASKHKIDEIAAMYPGNTYIEIKYNGEQLGLPYQAITDTQNTNAGYSWEAYLNRPRDYRILWQIRTNGTHRMIRWGDPEFVSRAVRASIFQDSDGFTIEPFTSYYPMDDFIFKPGGEITFKWDHQRNWFWYELWGRLGYDPDIPEEFWHDEFIEKYGHQAGPIMYRAMVEGSRLIPLLYSYRCRGYDHRDMAPEYEFGGTLEDMVKDREIDITVLTDKKDFMSPLDPNAMISIPNFVEQSLSLSEGEFLDAMMGPYEVANELDRLADETLTALAEAAPAKKKDEIDYEAMRAEFLVAVHIARYYADKFRAATAYGFYKQTNSWYDLVEAEIMVRSAHAHWSELAKHGKKYFRPLIDTLRMKTTEFTWEAEEKKLQADLDIINEQKKKYLDAVDSAKDYSIFLHPNLKPDAGMALEIKTNVLALRGGEKLTLHMKAADGQQRSKEFSRISGTKTGYKITVPAEWMAAGYAAFFVELTKGGEQVARYPERGAMKMIVREERNDPVIEVEAIRVVGEDTYRVFVKVTDDSAVGSVRLRYKPLPSESSWGGKLMKDIGSDTYVADLPVAPGGWIYYILASDVNGNAAAYPDFREATPYLAIDSFDPEKGTPY